MAACDPLADTGRAACLPARFGLGPAFRPRAGVHRGDHVLYAGRLAREKGVLALLEAAARSEAPWPQWLVGAGPAAALAFADAHRWQPVFDAELADLDRLAGVR
jgi:alpha-1,6-mannosyltransferase